MHPQPPASQPFEGDRLSRDERRQLTVSLCWFAFVVLGVLALFVVACFALVWIGWSWDTGRVTL